VPLPQPRGPLTAELIAVLTGDDPAARGLGPAARAALPSNGQGLRRLGFGERTTRFFDKHVEADAAPERPGRSPAGPDRRHHVRCPRCLALDGMVADHLLDSWQRGESALR
jgi:hypothetical protein